jgi:hypothetical protein
MGLILGTEIPGEPNHLMQSAGALKDRFGQPGPLDRSFRAYVVFAS